MYRQGKRSRNVPFALAIGIVTAALSGCAVGPNYHRPNVTVPDAYRGAASAQTAAAQPTAAAATPLGGQKWSEVFQDEVLQQLIKTALEQNYNVRIAATRILQAEAQLGITRADQFPTLDGGAGVSNERFAKTRFSALNTSQNSLGLNFAWELDFWGKYRHATESARAGLLANEWARQAVISTLVADVAGSYFQLRELDAELEISRRTLASRQDSLHLIQDLADQGLGTDLDVRQAEQLVFTAGAKIPDLERQIEQEENFISTLLGNNPGPIPRGRALTEQPHAPVIPAGLPSALLERRPDIREAEQQLIAFNAQIGVAKAAYFPQINLTGTGGFQSSALSSLFSGPAGLWSLAGGLSQPIFNGGRIRSGVRLAEAQQQEAVLVYQQTIQQAFREVSDALAAYRKTQELRGQQEQLVRAAEDASRLSDIRYRAGLTSYLEVLTNETNYFSAELGLAQARVNELESLVQLYRALGGGWQQ
jgi:outer membrane protein, multidrug efflux system